MHPEFEIHEISKRKQNRQKVKNQNFVFCDLDISSETVINLIKGIAEGKALEKVPRCWVGQHERNRRNRLLQRILRTIRFLVCARGIALVFEIQR